MMTDDDLVHAQTHILRLGILFLAPVFTVECIAAVKEKSRGIAVGIISLIVLDLFLRILASGSFEIRYVEEQAFFVAWFSRFDFGILQIAFGLVAAYLSISCALAFSEEKIWVLIRLAVAAPFICYPIMAFYNMNKILMFP